MRKGDFHRFLIKATTGLAYRKLTNLLKPLVGKEKYHDPIDSFVTNYLKHRFGLRRRPIMFNITSSALAYEGPASQALLMMSAISFCHATGMTYYHTPFKRIAHADRPLKEWAETWENFFNLGSGERRIDDPTIQVVNFVRLARQFYYLFDVSDPVNLFPSVLKSCKRKYWENRNKLVKQDKYIVVCVHVRRGDISSSRHGMWTSLGSVLHTLFNVSSILDNRGLRYEIHLFSQGEKKDFSVFDGMITNYHLNADPVWSMEQLINADILVTAKSTYSYVSALLTEGIVIYEPFWRSALPHWIVRSEDGSLDEEKFENKLNQLVGSSK